MDPREPQPEVVLAEISLDGCPEGPVLEPLTPRDEISKRFFAGWQTPLAPWNGFKGGSRLEVVRDGERTVLVRGQHGPNEIDRAPVWGDLETLIAPIQDRMVLSIWRVLRDVDETDDGDGFADPLRSALLVPGALGDA